MMRKRKGVAIQIRLFATLRHTAGTASVEVPQAEGDTVGAMLARLVDIHPELRPAIFDDGGQLAGHVRVIVNGREVRLLAGLDTPVQASDQISIFPPVGGGTSQATRLKGEPADSSTPEPAEAATGELTRVTLKFTGKVWQRMGCSRMGFVFAGHTLGALLNELFAHYDLQDLILNEEGEVRPWTRVVVNGRFSYLIGDMDAPIHDGDLVVLIHQYAVAF
jgi:molybdopterin synthase sulfur carrier subunit